MQERLIIQETAPALEKYHDPERREEIFNLARSALNGYYAASPGERVDFTEHAERVVKIAGAFAADLLPEPAYHAALLHDIVQRFESADRADATAALAIEEFLRNEHYTHEERRYVKAVLSDMKVIGQAAKDYRRRFVDGSGELTLYDLSVLRDGDLKATVSSALWAIDEPGASLKRMKKLAKNTNFESVVILAAEKIDHLQHPASDNEAKLLHDVLEAETFFAPLCEFWGLDAMAMTLRSAAAKRRLEKQGRHAAIDTAQRIHDAAMEFGGPERVTELLFGNYERRWNVEPREIDQLDESERGQRTVLSKLCEMNANGLRVVARVKSVGSLAKKLQESAYRNNDTVPMDIIGMTVVKGDVEQLAHTFCDAVQQLDLRVQQGVFTPQQPPSKDRPIFLQGDAAYREAVMNVVRERNLSFGGRPLEEMIQVRPDDRPFRVIKFMGIVHDGGQSVHAEVMFQTEEDREIARRHPAVAHALKSRNEKQRSDGEVMSRKKLAKMVKHIRGIMRRKKMAHRDNLGVNERSENRAEQDFGWRLAYAAKLGRVARKSASMIQ